MSIKKRYRRPNTKPGEIKMQYGRLEGDEPDLCYFRGPGVQRCDMHLIHNMFTSKRLEIDYDAPLGSPRYLWGKYGPSFQEELEARGYDLTTLKFSIQKKEQPK